MFLVLQYAIETDCVLECFMESLSIAVLACVQMPHLIRRHRFKRVNYSRPMKAPRRGLLGRPRSHLLLQLYHLSDRLFQQLSKSVDSCSLTAFPCSNIFVNVNGKETYG